MPSEIGDVLARNPRPHLVKHDALAFERHAAGIRIHFQEMLERRFDILGEPFGSLLQGGGIHDVPAGRAPPRTGAAYKASG